MGVAVIAWQLFIFFTIFISGVKRGWTTGFWIIWTIVQVITLPLSILQFATIAIAFFISKGTSSDASLVKVQRATHEDDIRKAEEERARVKLLVDKIKEASQKRRKKALSQFLLWGGVAAGTTFLFTNFGTNWFLFIVLCISTFLTLKYFIDLLD